MFDSGGRLATGYSFKDEKETRKECTKNYCQFLEKIETVEMTEKEIKKMLNKKSVVAVKS